MVFKNGELEINESSGELEETSQKNIREKCTQTSTEKLVLKKEGDFCVKSSKKKEKIEEKNNVVLYKNTELEVINEINLSLFPSELASHQKKSCLKQGSKINQDSLDSFASLLAKAKDRKLRLSLDKIKKEAERRIIINAVRNVRNAVVPGIMFAFKKIKRFCYVRSQVRNAYATVIQRAFREYFYSQSTEYEDGSEENSPKIKGIEHEIDEEEEVEEVEEEIIQ